MEEKFQEKKGAGLEEKVPNTFKKTGFCQNSEMCLSMSSASSRGRWDKRIYIKLQTTIHIC